MSIKIDDLAKEVMRGLDEYADVTTEQVKKAVRKAGNTVRKEIQQNAPKNTGDYAKSWAVKKVRESSHTLEVVVHSKNRYQLTHLLEFSLRKVSISRQTAVFTTAFTMFTLRCTPTKRTPISKQRSRVFWTNTRYFTASPRYGSTVKSCMRPFIHLERRLTNIWLTTR